MRLRLSTVQFVHGSIDTPVRDVVKNFLEGTSLVRRGCRVQKQLANVLRRALIGKLIHRIKECTALSSISDIIRLNVDIVKYLLEIVSSLIAEDAFHKFKKLVLNIIKHLDVSVWHDLQHLTQHLLNKLANRIVIKNGFEASRDAIIVYLYLVPNNAHAIFLCWHFELRKCGLAIFFEFVLQIWHTSREAFAHAETISFEGQPRCQIFLKALQEAFHRAHEVRSDAAKEIFNFAWNVVDVKRQPVDKRVELFEGGGDKAEHLLLHFADVCAWRNSRHFLSEHVADGVADAIELEAERLSDRLHDLDHFLHLFDHLHRLFSLPSRRLLKLLPLLTEPVARRRRRWCWGEDLLNDAPKEQVARTVASHAHSVAQLGARCVQLFKESAARTRDVLLVFFQSRANSC